MQNQRTLILAAILGVILGGVIVVKGVNRFIRDPRTKKLNEIQSLDDRIEAEERTAARVLQSKAMIADFTRRSLPPDALDAQRLYREWVHDLADVVGFDGLVVDPGKSIERQSIGQGRLRKPLYASVPVGIDGKTTLDRLCRFLYYFHRTNIPHRISDIKITSEENEGNPLLKVKMTVEALSMAQAAPRKRIFPESKLEDPLGRADDKAKVVAARGFPAAEPFQVRIGRNVATVTARKGTQWTIRPGVDPPPNGDADALNDVDAGKSVEYLPLTANPQRTFDDYRRDVFGKNKSPFVLPVPPEIYSPRLDVRLSQRVMRGTTLRFTARARDLNLEKGAPRFVLGKDAPRGMTIDAKTGEVVWKPTDKDPSKDYRAEIAMLQGTSEKPLKTAAVRIELYDPNVPPTLEVVTKHSGFLGTEIEFVAKGTDPDGDARRLRFSLSRAPSGAEIDSRSGVFRWTPGDDLEPGDYEFNVVVTDAGGDSVRKGVTLSLKQNAERFTKLIAVIAEEGKREAWLYDISTKEMKKLHEAEPFDAAGISGFTYVIGRDFIEFQVGKKSYRLPLGRFLSERELLRTKSAARSKPAKSSPVTTAGNPK
jgi:Putative Ig domain